VSIDSPYVATGEQLEKTVGPVKPVVEE